jgi:hypothetical protein
MKVLIGDANGVDRAIQQCFVNKGYENVVVYCMGEHCRNNLGSWPTKNISAVRKIKDFAYYSTKDLEMAKEASYGFMIWDGKSIGTLNNILNLLNRQKKVLVYFSIDKSCHTLVSLHELQRLFNKCDSSDLRRFEKKLSINRECMIQKPYEDLFSRQQDVYSKTRSVKVSHTAVASVSWLLSVGAKL